jgi:predicted outer membrane repeat protein
VEPGGAGDALTIQAGIDSASVGDTVLVAAGTYNGPGNRDLDFGGTDLVLLSEAGAELTIIDCEGSGRGFFFHSGETCAAVVEGVTVITGLEDVGGGILCIDSSPTIRSCTFSGNTATDAGGAMCVDYCSSTVSNCIFTDNRALEVSHWGGGGVYCNESFLTFDNCIFSGNSAEVAGGGMHCDYSSVIVRSCTFVGNSAPDGSGLEGGDEFTLIMENTIIAYGSGGWPVTYQSYYSVTLTCCDIFGNAGGDWWGLLADQLGVNGNFSACPSFCAAHAGDFHLCDESPCAPGNHPDGYDCGLIGAWPVGCSCGPTQTESTTWGSIKAMYR